MTIKDILHEYAKFDGDPLSPGIGLDEVEAVEAIKKVFLEMVGEDSYGLGEAISESEGAYKPSIAEEAEEEGFNNRGKIIRERIKKII